MPPTVLVIDDDTDQLEELGELVRAFGYPCFTADSGRKGRRMIRENGDIGIVLLDLYMPDLLGLDILSTVEDMGDSSSIQFIIISGQPHLDDAIEGFDRGAMTLLTKPIDVSELRRQLAAAARRLGDGHSGRARGHFRERAQKILELSRRSPDHHPVPPVHAAPPYDMDLYSLLAMADDISTIGESVARGALSMKALRLLSEVIRAHVRAEKLPVVTLCMAAEMPQTTALRHLSELVAAGLVEKQVDLHDRRRLLVALSETAGQELLDVSRRRTGNEAPATHRKPVSTRRSS